MGTKKGGRGKGKSTQVKKAEPVEVVETIEVMAEESPAENADPTHRGTKRKSDAISDDRQEGRESTVVPEPSPKRRLTRSRNSETQQIDYPVLDVVKPAPVKSVRGGRKRASSTARKASATSRATTASLRSVALDDAEIDAALEADLDKPMPDKPADESDTIEEPPKPKSRGRTKKTNASAAPTRSTRQATAELESSQVRTLEPEDVLQAPMVGQKDKDVGPKGKARKGRAPKKTGNKDAAPSVPNDSESIVALAADSQFNSSLLTAQTMASDSGHETDASVTSQKSITRKGSKRKANTRAKGKKAGAKNIEDIIHSQTGPKVVSETNPRAEQQLSMLIVEPDLPSKDIAEENVEEDLPKKATRATRAGKKKGNATKKEKPKVPQLSMPGMFSPLMGDMDPSFNSVLAPSSPPVVPATRSGLGWDNRIPVALSRTSSPKISRATENKPSTPTNARLSPAGTQTASQQRNPRTNEATPSPSPQSSDAENQPPSSRPPSVRPPLAPLSPTKSSIQRIPLAPGTPKQVPLSPSKIGGLKSEVPWTAVDVEMIFVPSPDKENRNIFAGPQKTELTSPEKAMSVEEWIKSQGNAAEMKLKEEAGRVVGIFEREGGRALRVLEGIDVL